MSFNYKVKVKEKKNGSGYLGTVYEMHFATLIVQTFLQIFIAI